MMSTNDAAAGKAPASTAAQRLATLFQLAWRLDRLGVLGSFLEVSTGLIVFFQALLLTRITASLLAKDFEEAFAYVVLLSLITGLTTILQVVGTNCRLRLVGKVTSFVENNTLEKLNSFRCLESLENPSIRGSLDLIFQQRGSVGRSLNVWIVACVNLCSLIGLTIAAVMISPWLLLLVSLTFPPVYFGVRAQQRIEDAIDSAKDKSTQVEALLEPLVGADGGEELAMLNARKFYEDEVRTAARAWTAPQREAIAGATTQEACGTLFPVVGTLTVLGFLLSGHITIADPAVLASLAFVTVRIAGVGGTLFYTSKMLKGADRAIKRWLDFHQATDALPAPRMTDPTSRQLKVENLSYQTPDGTTILKNLSFTLQVGHTVAIVGANGSGKSTLIALLAGVRVPTEGQIFFPGTHSVGFVPQRSVRLPATVRNNLCLDRRSDRGHITDADIATHLSTCGFRKTLHADRFVQPNKSVSTPHAWYPSGGEWKRIAIARSSLSGNHSLEIFDEPTAALDPAQSSVIRRLVCSTLVDERSLTLVVTHDIEVVEKCDLVLLLHRGFLLDVGSHQQIVDGPWGEQYQKLFNLDE